MPTRMDGWPLYRTHAPGLYKLGGRAMTQSTAAPTLEEWFVRDHPNAHGDIEVVLGNDFKIYIPLRASDWDDAKRSHMRNHARLIAAAPETAAERDRLRLEIEQCHAKSTCCCGDYIKHHSTHSGHNPVSMYDSDLFNVETERDRLKVVNEGLVEVLAVACKAYKEITNDLG